MGKFIRLSPADLAGIWMVTLIATAMFAFREFAIVPRATVGLCAAADAPGFCAARATVLWLQYQQLFGWAALALGLVGFFLGSRWPAVFAIAVGIAAVVNYNATTGIVGGARNSSTWENLV